MQEITTHTAQEDARNDHIKIYVNGNIVHRDDAKVSVYDSGFMLGDGIWEGLRLYKGKWAFLDEHIDRLFEAALAIDLNLGMSKDEVIYALEQTRLANDMFDDVHARLMFTRGVKSKPFQHPALSKQGPTLVIICEHSKAAIARPIKLATVPIYGGCP